MNAQDFLSLGADKFVYLRPNIVDGKDGWIVFAADGAKLYFSQDFHLAHAKAVQEDRVPLSVH